MSTNKRRAIQILHISTFQFTFKCGCNNFISKCTDINSSHVTQINLLHNNTRFICKKGSLRVNSVMILAVLSTHAELTSATARGRSYCETGELGCISPGAMGIIFWQPIGKPEEVSSKIKHSANKCVLYPNQFSNKKRTIGKPARPKRHPIWVAHPRTHLSTKYCKYPSQQTQQTNKSSFIHVPPQFVITNFVFKRWYQQLSNDVKMSIQTQQISLPHFMICFQMMVLAKWVLFKQ